jgi:hypothetical protein
MVLCLIEDLGGTVEVPSFTAGNKAFANPVEPK